MAPPDNEQLPIQGSVSDVVERPLHFLPPNQPPRFKNPKISDAEWEPYLPDICAMWLDAKTTRQDIVAYMETNGLHVTISQVQSLLRKHNWRRRQTTKGRDLDGDNITDSPTHLRHDMTPKSTKATLAESSTPICESNFPAFSYTMYIYPKEEHHSDFDEMPSLEPSSSTRHSSDLSSFFIARSDDNLFAGYGPTDYTNLPHLLGGDASEIFKSVDLTRDLEDWMLMPMSEEYTKDVLRYCKRLIRSNPVVDKMTGSDLELREEVSSLSFLLLTGKVRQGTLRNFDSGLISLSSLNSAVGVWSWMNLNMTSEAFWHKISALIWTTARIARLIADSAALKLSFSLSAIQGIELLMASRNTLQLVKESVQIPQCHGNDVGAYAAVLGTLVSSAITSTTEAISAPPSSPVKPPLFNRFRNAIGRRPLKLPESDSISQQSVDPEKIVLPERFSTSTTNSSIRVRLIRPGRLSWHSLGSGDIPSRMKRSSQSSFGSDLKLFLRDSLTSLGAFSDTVMRDSYVDPDVIYEEEFDGAVIAEPVSGPEMREVVPDHGKSNDDDDDNEQDQNKQQQKEPQRDLQEKDSWEDEEEDEDEEGEDHDTMDVDDD